MHRALLAILAMAFSLPLSPLRARAEVLTVEMPGDYADFALDPQTGNLLALDAENGQALLFRQADLKNENGALAVTIRVGSTPCSACYKRFGDARHFAVFCSQDSHMYLIDAEKGMLVAKIELAQSGVSYVTGLLPKI
jgi:hypothetical protein